MRLLGDFHRAGVLCPHVGGPFDGVVTGFELGQVHRLPAHGLIDGLALVVAEARVLDGGQGVPGDLLAGVAVLTLSAEGLADVGCAGELERPDVVHGHTGFGHAEEGGNVLAEVVGHLDAHRVDTGGGHGELQRPGLGIVLPHAHVRGVLDAVDRHAVDGPTVHGLAGLIVVGEDDLCGRGDGGNRDLALAGYVTGYLVSGGVEVEGGHRALVARGVDELDAGGGDHGFALLVPLGVGLRDVDEAGGVVHDEPVAHLRVGVVLGCGPVGELGTADVGTRPSDVVVGIRVDLEEDRVGYGLREHGVPMVGHAVAVVVRPERVQRSGGELVAVHHGGGHGEHVGAGEVIRFADVLLVRVLADVVLDALDGFALIDLDGLEGRRADAAVLVEG